MQNFYFHRIAKLFHDLGLGGAERAILRLSPSFNQAGSVVKLIMGHADIPWREWVKAQVGEIYQQGEGNCNPAPILENTTRSNIPGAR